eukprot:CAMPEP_0172621118 /NCGR_PEP_ID=MMETSP1068-20121228/109157_1 /TAXON_ID=35684 /ORGANISM="Pseudopedinella elastica, Strain CCMP716" /LENGTH=183 /DNA_ID=CAMNT_0013428711 /DNA_START=56 /DNA_END=607 /DNA_ORIENTATION=-
MDLLGAYGSGSDDSEPSGYDKKKTSATSESDDDSDSDDDKPGTSAVNEGGAAKRAPPAKPVSILPSVDALFSSTEGPAFLATANKIEAFTVAPLKKKQRVDEPRSAPESVAKPNIDPTARPAAPSAPAAAKPLAKLPESKPEKQRLNRKERVKEQRLKGQSGIGEDFKTWRTEDEMRMRQHYD